MGTTRNKLLIVVLIAIVVVAGIVGDYLLLNYRDECLASEIRRRQDTAAEIRRPLENRLSQLKSQLAVQGIVEGKQQVFFRVDLGMCYEWALVCKEPLSLTEVAWEFSLPEERRSPKTPREPVWITMAISGITGTPSMEKAGRYLAGYIEQLKASSRAPGDDVSGQIVPTPGQPATSQRFAVKFYFGAIFSDE